MSARLLHLGLVFALVPLASPVDAAGDESGLFVDDDGASPARVT